MRKISKLVALTMLLSLSWSQTSGKVRGTVSSADGQPPVSYTHLTLPTTERV